MTAYKSEQAAKLAANKFIKTNEFSGTRRVAFFKFTVPTGNAATSDTVDLITLPKGARILGGTYATEAMSTAAGTATLSIGDGTTANKYLDAANVDAAGNGAFAHTVALGFGSELTADTTLVATVGGEAWAAGKVLTGAVEYVVD